MVQKDSSIRLACSGDSSAIHQLLWSARNEIPLKENFADDAHKAWVSCQCREKRFWVVECKDCIAGAMLLKSDGIVSYLAVGEPHRRAGIARRLIAHAKRLNPILIGEVDCTNIPVIRLLESEGFRRKQDADHSNWLGYEWRLSPSE